MITQAILFIALPALLVYACFSDLFTMRISNRTCLAVLALFPLAAFAAGMAPAAVGMHLLAGLAVLAVSFTLFSLRWIGGGDAKLVAASAVWFGFEALTDYLVLSCLLGGGLTVLILLARSMPLPLKLVGHGWAERLHAPSTGVPYGIALGVAAMAMLPHSAVWRLAI
jgi:prepilin peptidase CpaA